MLGVKTLHLKGIPLEVQLKMMVCPGYVVMEGGTRVNASMRMQNSTIVYILFMDEEPLDLRK